MVTIIDLGLGNVKSVSRALSYLNIPNIVSDDLLKIANAEKIILPGVGNFFEASKRLHSTGLADTIREQVKVKKKPFLGICLGMQLLAEKSEESGNSNGLGFIKAKVIRLRCEKRGYTLPHIGWNDVTHGEMPLFAGIEESSCFYFVHSYELVLEDVSVESVTCNYGNDFVAGVKKDNIMGVQFHPEKSQRAGIKLLKNFAEGVY